MLQKLNNMTYTFPLPPPEKQEFSLLDKLSRLQSLYKIVDSRANLVVFQPNKPQLHFHHNKAKRNIILKSRRLGFTTYSAIDMLDNTLFTPNFQSLFISYDDASSTKVFDGLIEFNWDHFPEELKSLYVVDASNAKTLKLDFGDKTFSQIEVKTSGRGSGYNHIHISELGPISDKNPLKAKEIMSGTIPSLSPDGFLSIESTAQGEDNIFYKLYMEAQANPFAYKKNPKALKPFFYNWQWDPEIDFITQPDHHLPKDFLDYQRKHNELAEKNPELYRPITDIQITFWYQKFIESGSDWHILKENFPTVAEEAFSTSGLKVFTQESIQKQLPYIKKPISTNGEWTFYKEPNQRHTYTLGADPAEGVGRDHSAIVILDISTKPQVEVVATYQSNTIDPDLLAYEIKHQGLRYNNAFAVVERNNTGHGTLTRLKDLYPPSQIYTEHKEEYEETKQTDKLGFVTSAKTKRDAFMETKTLLDEHHINIVSEPLLTEIKMYGRKHLAQTKQKEETTNHFDALTALTLAVHGMKYAEDNTSDITLVTPKTDRPFNPFAPI